VGSAEQTLNINSPEMTSADAGVLVQGWLQHQRLDSVLPFLDQHVDNAPIYDQALFQLNAYLQQQLDAGEWALVIGWTERLLHHDQTNWLWQDFAVQAYANSGQRLKALSALFEAYDMSLAQDRRTELLTRIEHLLQAQLIQQKASAPTGLSENKPLMALMQLALEKQPYHPPFGLMMADIYEQSGDWEQALFQLNLLPYSEQYQAQIEANRQRLEQRLAELDRAQQGVPLQRMQDQFVVTAVFDGQVELRLMIDTGASITALSRKAIQLLRQYTHLQASDQQVQVNTANGVTTAALYNIQNMQVGGWVQRDVFLLEVDLGEQEVDGLLGMNFLGQYAFSIDQDQARLYLESK
jgi:clan AA aspartic protease (TIGR02281 family)